MKEELNFFAGPVTDGVYDAIITDSYLKKLKSKDACFLKIKWLILNYPGKHVVFDHLIATDAEKMRIYNTLSHNAIMEERFKDLIGIEAKIKIGVRNYSGNNINIVTGIVGYS